ncbi:MAG: serine/threonine protein phosphatase [Gammaproteobacteria bacterium]|nr:serine/threonine protein phosphatase [Gammaproteobacteria bacterium]
MKYGIFMETSGMPKELGDKIFSFGVITDTHLNPGEEDCNSPFPVNELANARMRHVVRDLNTRDLAFVINVGDLVHPLPAIPDVYHEAATRFLEQVEDLKHDLYLVPGNHDVGDKPNDWAPAAKVCEDYLPLWEKYFGPHFHSFDHGDCHFMVINAQIINSGFASETAQQKWLERDLEDNKNKRLFLNSHYPPYFANPHEDENYDNIGEPGRTWILDLLEKYKIEALFIGHVHNFWHNRYAETDCYLLPSTAFVRQDFSEMFHVGPDAGSEYGRNDKPKLGYFVVHVHEEGHVCEVVRTYGTVAEKDSPLPEHNDRVKPVHPRLNTGSHFGFDMRWNWMEIIEIPPTGGLDEFDRKEVRNDYPLLALWEMGVGKLRVPLQDLKHEENRNRMRMLRDHGHEFTLSTFGAPNDSEHKLILANQDIFSAWEIGYNSVSLDRIASSMAQTMSAIEIPVYLSKLRSIDELRSESGGKYYHAINQGFLPSDETEMQNLLEHNEFKGHVGGFVFRLTMDMDPVNVIAAADNIANDMGIAASVHLRMMGANPAEETADDLLSANRIVEAMLAARAHDNVTVFADTFADNDRGYFARNGVLDRLYNPRLGYYAVRNLNGVLNTLSGKAALGEHRAIEGGRIVTIDIAGQTVIAVLPDGSQGSLDVSTPHGSGRYIDLASGIVRQFDRNETTSGHMSITLSPDTATPVLLIIESD